MQIHLLDGTYELFRSHFGRPPRKGLDGEPVAATLGVVESVLSLLRDEGVTHLGCATDHVIHSWRNEQYAGYKTDEGMPPELLAQFPLLEDALRALGIVVWPMVEFEADDGLAAAAARFAKHPGVERVVILSPDKDMAQCVREDGRVVTFNRREGRFYDADGVAGKFGVRPSSIPDYLALVGDAADGFPGLPGWGAKSAAAVLSRYPHLEEIPDSAAAWDLKVRGAASLAQRCAPDGRMPSCSASWPPCGSTPRSRRRTPTSCAGAAWTSPPSGRWPRVCGHRGYWSACRRTTRRKVERRARPRPLRRVQPALSNSTKVRWCWGAAATRPIDLAGMPKPNQVLPRADVTVAPASIAMKPAAQMSHSDSLDHCT